jgi:hypothetical protein
MALLSSRLLIGQGLTALFAGVQNPATGTPLYSAVKLGAIFDPTGLSSWMEVTFGQAKSGPAGSGGNLIGWRIEDNPIWKLTSAWPYELDATAAMTAMLTAMDVLNPLIHSHYQVPNPTNTSIAIASLYSLLEDQQERSQPVKFPNGHVYLLWETQVTTKQQFNVSLVNP